MCRLAEARTHLIDVMNQLRQVLCHVHPLWILAESLSEHKVKVKRAKRNAAKCEGGCLRVATEAREPKRYVRLG